MSNFLTGKIIACPMCGEPMREHAGFLNGDANKLTPIYYCDPCGEARVTFDFTASRHDPGAGTTQNDLPGSARGPALSGPESLTGR